MKWGLYRDRNGGARYGNARVAFITDIIGWGAFLFIVALALGNLAMFLDNIMRIVSALDG